MSRKRDCGLTFEFTRSRKRAKPAVASQVQRRVRPRPVSLHGFEAKLLYFAWLRALRWVRCASDDQALSDLSNSRSVLLPRRTLKRERHVWPPTLGVDRELIRRSIERADCANSKLFALRPAKNETEPSAISQVAGSDNADRWAKCWDTAGDDIGKARRHDESGPCKRAKQPHRCQGRTAPRKHATSEELRPCIGNDNGDARM